MKCPKCGGTDLIFIGPMVCCAGACAKAEEDRKKKQDAMLTARLGKGATK